MAAPAANKASVLAELQRQSKSLTPTGDAAAADGWTTAQWRSAFDTLFLETDPAAGSSHQDDMLFFVRADARDKRTPGDTDPVFVRRWSSALPADLSCDWRQSVYLNVVAHTRFSLTVAVCSYAGLKAQSPARTYAKVVKPVYAAPSVARVDLRTSKADGAPQASWPELYFSVYDFSDAFTAAVVSEPDHCLVVELRAWGGPALGGRAATGSSAGVANSGSGGLEVSLFSGLVASQHVQAAYRRVSGGAARRVIMAGPGGRGRVEVAVTQTTSAAAPLVPSGAAPPLQCSVMSICLPWDALARDILSKV